MSTISLTSNGISGDYEILFDDETVGGNAVAGMRMIRRASGATTTVHTTRALYSAVADKSDEFLAMGFKNPMLPVTPNAFTLENHYFMPRSSMEFLKEGAIEADWTAAAGEGVIMKLHDNTGTPPASGDIGRQVTEATSTDTGTLLDYEKLPDGTYVLWIRPDDVNDLFDETSAALTTTGDGGTMSVTGTAAATSGTTLVPSIQAIGSVPSATEVYLIQDRYKMTDWEGNFQWWATDPSLSLGIIDILIRTTVAGTVIADGDVEVFGRRYSSLYDNFRLNVSAGGRAALPLASSPDINNTSGYRQLTGSAGVSDFDVGNYMYEPAAGGWAAATSKGVITKVAGTVGAPIIDYYLIGDLNDFENLDTVKEWDPVTELDGDGSCTAAAPIAAPEGPTDSSAGEGGTVTITLGYVAGDHDGNGTDEYYSVEVDAQTDVTAAKVYERIKYVTRRGATAADLFATPTNMTGEQYRGLDGLFEYDASTGTLGAGEDLFTTTGGNTWTGKLASQNTTSTPDYITVMDQQTSLDSVVDNDVIEDEAGTEDVTVRSVGGGGTLGLQTFISPKSSPFGTFTGTQIFGARGVLYVNPLSTEAQAYILTDDLGNLIEPPNTVAFVVNTTVAGDHVYAARDTGVAGVIDKDQFGKCAVTAVSAKSIQVTGTIDVETTTAAWVRVIAVDEQQEHYYKYDSVTKVAGGIFTLTDITAGTADTGTSDTVIHRDTAAPSWITEGLVPGMLIYVAGRTSTYEVVDGITADQANIQLLYGAGGFVATDAYTINETIQGYDTSDEIHDLFLNQIATGDPTSVTFVKTKGADYGAVVNVRNGKNIIPFTQNVTVGDTGGSATVVRTTDTIAIP